MKRILRNIAIQDDGSMLREDNWEVSWQKDSVDIILKGSEQPDKVFTVQLE